MTTSAEPADHDQGAAVAARVERRWSIMSAGLVGLMIGVAIFAGVHRATMPQAWVETANPQTIHIAGEFVESNLGSAMEADGAVTVRAVGQQFSFTPPCLVVPTDTPVTLRATSADVVHGLLITGTTVNTMLVPGYIAVLPMRFRTPGDYTMPCQEFCGLGHEGMWAKIRVLDKTVFARLAATQRRLTCVD
jgi:cytochrome c oxidase subunit 2